MWPAKIIEKATVPMKTASPNKGPSIIPMAERFWRPIPKAQRYESCETAFEACTQCSSTRTSSSRTRWSSILANIEAENGRRILSCTFLELRYVGGDVNKNIEQDEIWVLTWRTRRTSIHEIKKGHSGVLEVPYEWKTHNCHTRSSDNYRSIVQGWLIAEEDKHASSQRWIHWIIHCPK